MELAVFGLLVAAILALFALGGHGDDTGYLG